MSVFTELVNILTQLTGPQSGAMIENFKKQGILDAQSRFIKKVWNMQTKKVESGSPVMEIAEALEITKRLGTVLHDARSCDQIPLNETSSTGICRQHTGVPPRTLSPPSVLGPELSRPLSSLRNKYSRTIAMSDEAFDSAAVGAGGRCAEADGSVDQRPEVATLLSTTRSHTSVSEPNGALHSWLSNGMGSTLAPRLINPGVLCYMNAVVSCLLICRSQAPAASRGWGLIDELFRVAGSEVIDLLPDLECLQPCHLDPWRTM